MLLSEGVVCFLCNHADRPATCCGLMQLYMSLHQGSFCSQQLLSYPIKDGEKLIHCMLAHLSLAGSVSETQLTNMFCSPDNSKTCHCRDSRSARRAGRRRTSTHYQVSEGPPCKIWPNENRDCNNCMPVLNSRCLRWLPGWGGIDFFFFLWLSRISTPQVW